MDLLMKPVCRCGHIFDNLSVKRESQEIPMDSYSRGHMFMQYTIEPCCCPSCKEKIDCVKFFVPVNGEFEYHDDVVMSIEWRLK